MRRFSILTSLILVIHLSGFSQSTPYFRSVTDTLASRAMAGRGYVEDGTLKAAAFIKYELERAGLTPLWPEYYQPFNIPINTITGDVRLSIDDREYKPGKDFTVSSFSRGGNFKMAVHMLPDKASRNLKSLKKYFRKNRNIEALVINLAKIEDKEVRGFLQAASYQQLLPVKACIFLTDKAPGWHVARAASVQDYIVINLRAELEPDIAQMTLSFGNSYYPAYQTQNVGAYIKGTQYPDSFLVFTAHYDHLGMMGNETWFPGYNDNASGTAMLLDLARHLMADSFPPKMSIAFLFLSAEETGLKGAYYAAANPPFPLPKINSLINLDMVGTGSEGITVVNANIYKVVFESLDSLNKACKCLPDVAARNESPNSDHHAFHEKGVPAVFIYTRGKDYREYHTVADEGPLPLSGYAGLFSLMRLYISSR
jgi:aminopeptidase YwaD